MLHRTVSIASMCFALCNCAPLAPVESAADAMPADAAVATSDSDRGGDALVADAANEPTYANVRALFASRCSGYCHAGGTDIGASLVLAPENGSAPMIVDRASREVTRLMLIAPGDPENSYLFRKIEGTMPALPECSAAGNHCGIPMPYAYVDGHSAVTLPPAQREMIRRWILDGAHVPAT